MGRSDHGDPAPGPPEHREGADDIGSVIRGLLGDPRLRRGVSLGRLAAGWERVVGVDLAAESAPRAIDGGVLLVATSSPGWAARVRFLAPDIRRRANELLGAKAVLSVTVTVGLGERKRLRRKGSGGAEGGPGTSGSRPPEW